MTAPVARLLIGIFIASTPNRSDIGIVKVEISFLMLSLFLYFYQIFACLNCCVMNLTHVFGNCSHYSLLICIKEPSLHCPMPLAYANYTTFRLQVMIYVPFMRNVSLYLIEWSGWWPVYWVMAPCMLSMNIWSSLSKWVCGLDVNFTLFSGRCCLVCVEVLVD